MKTKTVAPSTWLPERWISVLAHVGSLLPLVILVIDFLADRLTANPIQQATIRTGKTALILLVLSLACTPINKVFGFRPALRVRRALGLYGFLYVCVHLFIFSVLDFGIDLQLIWQELIHKPYVLAGFGAFLLLVPLAITSTKAWQKRLGKEWKLLHKLFYLISLIVVLHFALVVKSITGRPEPLIWGAGVIILLLLRLPALRKTISSTRARLTQKQPMRPMPTVSK